MRYGLWDWVFGVRFGLALWIGVAASNLIFGQIATFLFVLLLFFTIVQMVVCMFWLYKLDIIMYLHCLLLLLQQAVLVGQVPETMAELPRIHQPRRVAAHAASHLDRLLRLHLGHQLGGRVPLVVVDKRT